MKFIILIVIIFVSGVIGFEIKKKYIEQKELLLFLRSFLGFASLNISIYKNNIDEIINSYLIQQKNKNAKYNKIFQKDNNLYTINKEILNNHIYNNELKFILNSFFEMFGKGGLENECVKLDSVLKNIDYFINKSIEDIRTKGDLYFKICLAIGVVVVIVLW